MLVHMGGDVMVRIDDVIGIFDRESVLAGGATREMLGFARARGAVEDVAGGEARSLVLCRDRVVLSPVSSQTLRARVHAFGRQRHA